MKKIHWGVVLAGVAVGLAALILTAMGNPANMGFCIACFLRDTAGACGLHSAAKVQYVRPEIIGLVLGAFLMSVAGKEFKARAGSSPALRFVIGGFVVIGALAFLGCPLRMVLRLGGGDLNALVGLIGFFIGILIGIACLKRGFTLKRSYEVSVSEGSVLPTVMADPRADRTRAVQGVRGGARLDARAVLDRACRLARGRRAGAEEPPLHGRRSARRRDAGGLPPALRLRGDFCRHARRQSCHE